MKGVFNKHFWKFLTGFLAIMTLGFFALIWANVYHNGQNSEQYRGEKYLKDLKKAYDEDTYGGKTPEETLQLFIDALKNGDVDLAAKYFIPDERQEKKEFLEKIKSVGNLALLIGELSKADYSKKDFNGQGEMFVFNFYNERDQTSITVDIARIPNGTWKIVDL